MYKYNVRESVGIAWHGLASDGSFAGRIEYRTMRLVYARESLVDLHDMHSDFHSIHLVVRKSCWVDICSGDVLSNYRLWWVVGAPSHIGTDGNMSTKRPESPDRLGRDLPFPITHACKTPHN